MPFLVSFVKLTKFDSPGRLPNSFNNESYTVQKLFSAGSESSFHIVSTLLNIF